MENFRQDIESAPFHLATIFNKPNDVLWLWQTLFNSVCVPWKEVKIRSRSDPWITSEIRFKINNRYRIFKAALESKCPELWSKYKIPRNEVTLALRRAKASYFTKMFEEVKKTSAYWKLINKATNRIERKRAIGPFKRNDGTLALMYKR